MKKVIHGQFVHDGRVSRSAGFTLLELLVTVTVMAIILGVGVPGFFSFIQNQRAVTYTNELVTAFNLGRNEAARRGVNVIVCSSTDGTVCADSADWSRGWVVRTAGGEVIRSWREPSAQANVISGLDGATQVVFQARGTTQAARNFQVRLPSCTGNQGRDLNVNRAGRISVVRVNCA